MRARAIIARRTTRSRRRASPGAAPRRFTVITDLTCYAGRFDTMGDRTTLWTRWRRVTLGSEIRFPHSLGLLYLRVYGLSRTSRSTRANTRSWAWLRMACRAFRTSLEADRCRPDGAFALNLDYFSFHYSATRTYSRVSNRCSARRANRKTPFFTDTSGYPSYFGDKPSNYRELASRESALRGSGGKHPGRDRGDSAADGAQRLRPFSDDASVHGGRCRLNSVANGRILKETPVTDLYIQPAAGDSGAALGAALFVAASGAGRAATLRHGTRLLGAAMEPDDVRATAEASGMRSHRVRGRSPAGSREPSICSATGKVIGWAPRADSSGARARLEIAASSPIRAART